MLLLVLATGAGGCVNLNAEPEPVLSVDQPDSSQAPIFTAEFPGTYPELFSCDKYEEPCRTDYANYNAVGGGRYFHSSELLGNVRVYDAQTRALEGYLGTYEASGITFYRGEVFVVDKWDSTIKVYDPATRAQKRVIKPPSVFPGTKPSRDIKPRGIDAAWNELWLSYGGDVGGGGIIVLDAQTGAAKAIFWHQPRYDCARDPLKLNAFRVCRDDEPANVAGLSQCTGGLQGECDPDQIAAEVVDSALPDATWADIATVPERAGVIVGCRFINRGTLLQPTPTDELPVNELLGANDCANGGDQQGVDAVWGMNWLMTARAGGPVREYALNGDGNNGVVGSLRRTGMSCSLWHTTTCDVAYQNREARIDWKGALTGHDWLRGTKCVDYVVSDADIFVAGDVNRQYYEPARGFQKIEMTIDGGWRQEKLTSSGQFCQDLTQVPSGTHTVRLKAWINNGSRTVTVTNAAANFDRDPPRPTVTAPEVVTGTVSLTGASADDHSHARRWRPQILRGSWQNICDQENTDPGATAPTYSCSWDTQGGPDGSYAFRAEGTDYASDGGNTGWSAQRSIVVDNTQPTVSVSGELKEREDQQLIWDDERPQLHVDANDAASGVASVEVLVDSLRKDFRERSCIGPSCGPLVFDFTLVPTDYPEGNHPVQVVVTDHAGHTRSESWTVNVKRTPPDTVDESATDATDQPGSPPDPAEPTEADVPQDDSDLDGSNSIASSQALQCPAADEFVVTSVIDSEPTLPADLGNGLLPSAPTLGFPTAELAVADFLNTSVMLPKIPPAIFASAVKTADYALFVARVDGNIEGSIEVAKYPNGGWFGGYFSACSMFVDDYLGVTR